MRKTILFIAISGLSLSALAHCGSGSPDRKFFPDMYDSVAIEPQESDAMSHEDWQRRTAGQQLPVPNTEPRGWVTYPYMPRYNNNMTEKDRTAEYNNQRARAVAALRNPMPMSPDVLARGEKQYQIYCEPCHNSDGKGGDQRAAVILNGFNLLQDVYKNMGDGELFHIISAGGPNQMGSYASQIEVEDRWAIINYLRLLQTQK